MRRAQEFPVQEQVQLERLTSGKGVPGLLRSVLGHFPGEHAIQLAGRQGAQVPQAGGQVQTMAARVLRLTLLAPDIVEAILDGRQRPEVTLARVLEPFPVEWMSQGAAIELDRDHS